MKTKTKVTSSTSKFNPEKAIKKQVIILEYDWKKVPAGTWFTAQIEGRDVTGRIQKQSGKIYLCNSVKKGLSCKIKFGFIYSWVINKGTLYDLKDNNVTNLKLLSEKPKDFTMPEPPIIINGNTVVFSKGNIKVGCTAVSNKVVREVVKKLID